MRIRYSSHNRKPEMSIHILKSFKTNLKITAYIHCMYIYALIYTSVVNNIIVTKKTNFWLPVKMKTDIDYYISYMRAQSSVAQRNWASQQ